MVERVSPRGSSELVELDDARTAVLSRVHPLEPVTLPLAELRGRVVAQAVVARENIPGFVNSSMDGFAVRARDTLSGSARLRVVDSVHAGATSSLVVQPGCAVRIMTGAPLPEGADAVCMLEDTVADGDHVIIHRVVTSGDYLRGIGDDTRVGQELFVPGDVLSPAGVGVLAGQGVSTLLVHPRPRVGVLSTGDEVVGDGGPLGAGQIRDLNRPMVLGLVEESGCVPVDLGIAPDTREAITRAIARAVESCDVVVTTGGVSVGDVDYVKVALTDLAPETAMSMRVAMKPGKPFAFAVVGPREVPVFGLPGNPVSTRVSFEMFVRPALRRRAGVAHVERFSVSAVLDHPLERPLDGKVHLLHVNVAWGDDGRVHVLDIARRDSHLLHAVSTANALAVVPTVARLDAGSSVRVIVLDTDSLGTPP